MNKKIGALLSVLLLIAIAIFGVMYSRKLAKVEVADRFFQQVFTNMEQQAEEARALNTEEALLAWLEERYGAFFTEEGWKEALENRVMLLSLSESEMPKEVEVRFQQRERLENCYFAEIVAVDNKAFGTYYFFFNLEQKDGEWLISSIGRGLHAEPEENIEASLNDSFAKQDKDEEYRIYRENLLAELLQDGYGLTECKVEMVCEGTKITEVSVLMGTGEKELAQTEAEIVEYISKSTDVPAEKVFLNIMEDGTSIGMLAMVVLPEGWSIAEETVKEDYAAVSFMYQSELVASVELGVNALDFWMDSKTTAESFVANYVGMHAELVDNSRLETTSGNMLTKVIANPGMSAAETVTATETPENEIWYFGISQNDVYVIVQLWDAGKQEEVENILRGMYY